MQTIYPQRARMTIGQQRAWDRNWGRWGADVADLPAGPLDATGWFGRAAPVVLEIGSGMGESTAVMALASTRRRPSRCRDLPAWTGPATAAHRAGRDQQSTAAPR